MGNPLDTLFQSAQSANARPHDEIGAYFTMMSQLTTSIGAEPLLRFVYGYLVYSPSLPQHANRTGAFNGVVAQYTSDKFLFPYNPQTQPVPTPPFSATPDYYPTVFVGFTPWTGLGNPQKYVITLTWPNGDSMSLTEPNFDDPTQILYGQIGGWGLCTISLALHVG